MPLPLTYPIGAPAIATYDFVDLASGTGVVTYYGAVTKDPTAEYVLLETQSYSAQRETIQNGVGTNTVNFDLTPFNMPRTAKGTAKVSCAVYNQTDVRYATVTAQLKKISGADVTNISSAIVSEQVTGTANMIKMVLLELPLTQTHFKRGEILRLSIGITVDADIGAFGHAPNNTPGETYMTAPRLASDNSSTILKLLMPFRIDI